MDKHQLWLDLDTRKLFFLYLWDYTWTIRMKIDETKMA